MIDFEQGSLIFGKYKVVSLLGKGSFSKVYLVQHIKLESYRAIKCILKQDELYEQLMREVGILRGIRNENIPLIYDIEEDEECSYIIEEFCQGVSLREYVLSDRIITIRDIIDYSMQISNLLCYLHSQEKRILYLDLKPDNLIISDNSIKLIDFGAAVICDDCRRDDAFFGSERYSSPEQKQGGDIDIRCDVYSFGVLLEFMLKAFKRRVGICDKEKVKELDKLSKRCKATNPAVRIDSFEAVKEQLQNIREEKKQDKKFFRRIRKNESKKRGFRTVGIMGAVKGCGSTHITLMVADMIKKKEGGRIACVDLSGGSDYFFVCKAEDGDTVGEKLVFKDIGYYPKGNEQLLLKLINEDYDHIIIDFGNRSRVAKKEFMLCDVKLLVGLTSDWRLPVFEEFLKNNEEAIKKGKWGVVFNLTGENKAKKLGERYKLKAVGMGFEENFNNASQSSFDKICSLFE